MYQIQGKYKAYPVVSLENRNWPSNTIQVAPILCSVDLRDGNQALIQPMNLEEKMEMFQVLIDMQFKEIEIGFPSASEVEYKFTRKIIEDKCIPRDTKIQVITQARKELISKTMDSIKGAENVIIHLYNSTSTIQRNIVFRKSKQEIINIAVDGVKEIKKQARNFTGNIQLQYSPESFTATELDFAYEMCEAVREEWNFYGGHNLILNLPATVEMSTPNIFADRIEWFHKHISNRDRITLSVHTHNDRGCAVAAAELSVLAGADRVEGTLFGNGERSGNMDIVTFALNLYTQGVDPKIDLSNLNRAIHIAEKCNKIKVPERQPYAGELVYTAFSGSHQDAISKGMRYRKETEEVFWDVPYIPIDPEDIGRTYDSIIRINSQSGKGGVAYVLEKEYGISIPKEMQPIVSKEIQKFADENFSEIGAEEIYNLFSIHFMNARKNDSELDLIDIKPIQIISELKGDRYICFSRIEYHRHTFWGAYISGDVEDARQNSILSAYNRFKKSHPGLSNIA
ncbi:MAG: 2-isopropylmalate synthase [Leptospiraceae bacterium]|nr:2-isopropylmalate synthase [Leptospiraceae bacterium]